MQHPKLNCWTRHLPIRTNLVLTATRKNCWKTTVLPSASVPESLIRSCIEMDKFIACRVTRPVSRRIENNFDCLWSYVTKDWRSWMTRSCWNSTTTISHLNHRRTATINVVFHDRRMMVTDKWAVRWRCEISLLKFGFWILY